MDNHDRNMDKPTPAIPIVPNDGYEQPRPSYPPNMEHQEQANPTGRYEPAELRALT